MQLKRPKRYHFTYKVINMINKKYYYGVHFTDKLKDGYKGSGTIIRKAHNKYGKENFILIYLAFFKTPEEAFLGERKLITKEDLLNPMCYNLVLGGNGYPTLSHKDILHLKEQLNNPNLPEEDYNLISEKIQIFELANQKRSKHSKGYNNPDFVANTFPKYEVMKNDFISLCKNTSLYDYDIKQILLKKYNFGFKWPTIINYYKEVNYFKTIQVKKEKDYSTFSSVTIQKTILDDIQHYSIPIFILYEDINLYFNKYIPYLLDERYSDSYLTQEVFRGNNISLSKVINYFSLLGLISIVGKKTIEIREVCPNSHRKYSTKTIISVDTSWVQKKIILKRYEYNKSYIFKLYIDENNLPKLNLEVVPFDIFSILNKKEIVEE